MFLYYLNYPVKKNYYQGKVAWGGGWRRATRASGIRPTPVVSLVTTKIKTFQNTTLSLVTAEIKTFQNTTLSLVKTDLKTFQNTTLSLV